MLSKHKIRAGGTEGWNVSVIAWDGKMVVADRQIMSDGLRQLTKKIWRLKTGEVIGCVGGYENGLAVAKWYEDGADPDRWPDSQSDKNDWASLVVFKPDGSVIEFERLPIAQPVMETFFAWGTGRELAIGAMAAGADAREAVCIVNRYSTTCGIGVDILQVVS